MAYRHGGFAVPCGEHELVISPTGCVTNFRDIVQATHGTLLHAWGSQWNSMLHSLSCSWEEPQHPFMDILLFVVLAAKTRRAQNKQPWKRVSASLLHLLQLSVITALHDILHIFIWQTYLPGHVDDQGHIPSRRMRQGLFPCVVHIKVACKPS